MDSQKFDSLVKTLASPTSRRRTLKGAAALGAGSLLSLLGREVTEAARCDENNLEKCGSGCCGPSQRCCTSGGPRCIHKRLAC
jgi:hypothetical protein